MVEFINYSPERKVPVIVEKWPGHYRLRRYLKDKKINRVRFEISAGRSRVSWIGLGTLLENSEGHIGFGG